MAWRFILKYFYSCVNNDLCITSSSAIIHVLCCSFITHTRFLQSSTIQDNWGGPNVTSSLKSDAQSNFVCCGWKWNQTSCQSSCVQPHDVITINCISVLS